MHRIEAAILLVLLTACSGQPGNSVQTSPAKPVPQKFSAKPIIPVSPPEPVHTAPIPSKSNPSELKPAEPSSAQVLGPDGQSYARMMDEILENADLRSSILKAVAEAKKHNRHQIIFSLYEAGLDHGVNLLIDEMDAIDVDFPKEKKPADMDSFNFYKVGSSRIRAKLSDIIRSLPEREGMDFILTTHDTVYFLDLKTGTDFKGDLKFR